MTGTASSSGMQRDRGMQRGENAPLNHNPNGAVQRHQGKRRNVMAVLTQYLAERQYSLLIPLYILVLMWLISVIIVLLMGIKAGLPLPTSIQEGNAVGNVGSVMSTPYFLVVGGALCVNRQFNAALSFGSTRRDFWIGTTLGFFVTAAASGIFVDIALLCEKITNHWWLGVHAFDVAILGSGNYILAFLVMFTLTFTSLMIGATFGTVFRSFGTKALAVSIIATGVVLLAAFAVSIWQSTPILRLFAEWGVWTLIAFLGVASLIMTIAGYCVNQHATI
ncbi:hypothetical protein [Bifidobacterium aquikefiricola]|uniref:ABC transporter permease n=1 Tax=Bifidobacterium aquikefiricola TaxID=3059038 RepID=A0AB39U715_9BIFI